MYHDIKPEALSRSNHSHPGRRFIQSTAIHDSRSDNAATEDPTIKSRSPARIPIHLSILLPARLIYHKRYSIMTVGASDLKAVQLSYVRVGSPFHAVRVFLSLLCWRALTSACMLHRGAQTSFLPIKTALHPHMTSCEAFLDSFDSQPSPSTRRTWVVIFNVSKACGLCDSALGQGSN